jgi:hypothetical protein
MATAGAGDAQRNRNSEMQMTQAIPPSDAARQLSDLEPTCSYQKGFGTVVINHTEAQAENSNYAPVIKTAGTSCEAMPRVETYAAGYEAGVADAREMSANILEDDSVETLEDMHEAILGLQPRKSL